MNDTAQLRTKHQFFMRRAIALALIVAPILLCLYFISKFAVEVPIYDEWKFVALAAALKSNTFSEKMIDLHAHVDHILFFTHFIMLVIGYLTKFSFIAEMWGSIFILSCINILLLRLGWRFFHGYKNRYLALIPLPWIMCNLRQWDNFLMGYQICMFLVALFYLMSVIFLSATKNINRYFVGAVICSFIATISFGAGLMAWPLGFIQLLLQNCLRMQVRGKTYKSIREIFYYHKTTLLWFVIGIAMILFYKSKYIPGPNGDVIRLLQTNWTALPAFFFASFGNAFAADNEVNKVFSLAIIFLLFWTIWLLKNQDNSIKYKFIAPIMLVIFAIAYCMLLSIGRVIIMPATVSRYSTIPILGFAGLYITVVGGYLRMRQKFNVPLGFTIALSVLSLGIGMPLAFVNGQALRNERLTLAQISQNYKLQNEQTLETLVPGSWYLKMALAAIDNNHWSYFAHKPLALADLSEIAVPNSDPEKYCSLDSINGHPIVRNANMVIDTSTEPSFKFQGWAVRPEAKALAGGAFVIIDNKYVVPAAYGISRSDVKLSSLPDAPCCGYWGICRSDLFSKGKHSFSLAIVDQDERHYYLVADICTFETK